MDQIQPDRVIEILKEQGTEVNLNQAKAIIGFLKKIAGIFISEYIHDSIINFKQDSSNQKRSK